MERLHGILTTYKMKKKGGNSEIEEVVLKATSKGKQNQGQESSNHTSNDEEGKKLKRLQKGTKKYKGMFPFKCFNYGRVGHYASKFPFKKEENQFKGKKKNTPKKM